MVVFLGLSVNQRGHSFEVGYRDDTPSVIITDDDEIDESVFS